MSRAKGWPGDQEEGGGREGGLGRHESGRGAEVEGKAQLGENQGENNGAQWHGGRGYAEEGQKGEKAGEMGEKFPTKQVFRAKGNVRDRGNRDQEYGGAD